MSDLASIFFLSLLSMLNPMLGYLLGAYVTSISLGLLIVFSLNDSSSVSTAKRTLSPVEDIVVGLILLLVAFVLGGGRGEQLRERRRQRKEQKQGPAEEKKSLPERMLGSGSTRITFAAGVLLTFPGVSYLAALDRMAKLDTSDFAIVLLVVGFCLVQQLLLEVPSLGYAFAPERTQRAVTGFREWLARNGRRAGTIVAAVLGALLLVRGLIELLT